MSKLKALLIVAVLVIAGCGQKGPLLVDPPKESEPEKTESEQSEPTKTESEQKDS